MAHELLRELALRLSDSPVPDPSDRKRATDLLKDKTLPPEDRLKLQQLLMQAA